MKRFKKLGVALLSATLLLIPCMTSINAQDNPYDTWKTTALKSPSKGQLVAAGDIKISWSPLEKVQHYDIYFDGKYEKSVEANITQTTIYSTAVARHTIRVVAVLENNDEINVSERTFYISKKGIGLYEDDQGINSLSYVQNMGVSWYYNWGEEAYDNQDEVNSELEFVPMIWNDAGNVSERLKSLKEKGYDKVLSFNEPDYDQEANMSVDLASSYNQDFHSRGLRVGSPAVSESTVKENGWFENYWNRLEIKDDFIAVHNYPGYVGLDSEEYTPKKAAKSFLKYMNDIYDCYQKPIWVTEFAVAAWDSNEYWHPYDGNDEQHNKAVQEFMKYVINGFDDIQGLDELSFVERYAWFSFDATQLQSAASALFYNTKDTSNQNQLGVLTNLGNVYRNECGNPLHYTLPYLDGSKDPSSIEEDRYIEDQFHHDVIQGDDQINKQLSSNIERKSVQTDDQTSYMFFILIMITSLMGIFLLKNKNEY